MKKIILFTTFFDIFIIAFFPNILIDHEQLLSVFYSKNIIAKNAYTLRDVPVGFVIPIPKDELRGAGFDDLERYITMEYFFFSEIEYDVIPELTINIVRGDIINEKETLVLIDMDFHGYEFPKMIDDYQEYYDYLFFTLGISFFEDETLTNKCQLSRIEGTEKVGYFHAKCDVETDVLYLGRQELVSVSYSKEKYLKDIEDDEIRPMKFETKSFSIDPVSSDLCETHRCIENKPVYCIDEEVMGNIFLEGPLFADQWVWLKPDTQYFSAGNIRNYMYFIVDGNIDYMLLEFDADDSFTNIKIVYKTISSDFVENGVYYHLNFSSYRANNLAYDYEILEASDTYDPDFQSLDLSQLNLIEVSTTDWIDYIWDMNCHINQ